MLGDANKTRHHEGPLERLRPVVSLSAGLLVRNQEGVIDNEARYPSAFYKLITNSGRKY